MLSTTEAAASAQLLLNYFSIKCQLNLDIMFATRIEFPALGATKKKEKMWGSYSCHATFDCSCIFV